MSYNLLVLVIIEQANVEFLSVAKCSFLIFEKRLFFYYRHMYIYDQLFLLLQCGKFGAIRRGRGGSPAGGEKATDFVILHHLEYIIYNKRKFCFFVFFPRENLLQEIKFADPH